MDEVDKRRHSGEGCPVDPESPIDLPVDSERRHASNSLVPSPLMTIGCIKTPIPEDDKDQLSPLPLNRHPPSASPIPSPSRPSSSLNVKGRETPASSSRHGAEVTDAETRGDLTHSPCIQVDFMSSGSPSGRDGPVFRLPVSCLSLMVMVPSPPSC